MEIYKVLNNNFVIVLDDNGMELIIGGKGIAYGKKPGNVIDNELINKTFVIPSNSEYENVQKFIDVLPIEYFEIAIEIVEFANLKVVKKINKSVCLAIADHIYTSVERTKIGVQIPNYMLWELKKFYKEEFEVGLYALKLIEEKFGNHLLEDEAGFIAMHIVNSELEQVNVDEVYKTATLIKKITNIVKYFFNIEFDNDSIYYYRFITHLKFFANRLFSNYTFNNCYDDMLYEMIRKNYKNAFNCSSKIENFLLQNYSYTLSKEEKIYLTIHIENIIYKSKKYDN